MARRDARLGHVRRPPPRSRSALHSGSTGPEDFSGDAELSGRAEHVTDDAERAAFAKRAGVRAQHMDFELFRVDLEQVVLVALNDERTALMISSWRPGRGLTGTSRCTGPAFHVEPAAGGRWTAGLRGTTLGSPHEERPR